MSAHDDATLRQILAADPAASTWVTANAGSGKTRVLTDRVARLLLIGVAPERILCLTYTKAAAAEMQNRLFRRLGEWAMLPDDALRKELFKLGSEPGEEGMSLREARRLFARAIEAPGGLKVQTIHAFCASLLRRFPLEAGVSPDFAEMDDRAQALMFDEILNALAAGSAAKAVEAVARFDTGDDLRALLAEIARNRTAFGKVPSLPEVLREFGAPPDLTEARVLATAFTGGERQFAAAIVPLLDPENRQEKRPRASLASLGPMTPPTRADLLAFEDACLTGHKTKSPFSAKIEGRGAAFPKKEIRQLLGSALDGWDDAQLRIEEAARLRRALDAAERTRALHALAVPFLAAYEARKQASGVLDFDDLILRAGALLGRPGVAEWVLYRLDGGIDHILVDEAQDTSPAQWDVVRLIAEEFSAGQSARSGAPRTLFVVGDLKQSIYSFQGAEPDAFARMNGHFSRRLEGVGERLATTELLHSFRSAPAILRVVDQAFARPDRHAGLGGAPYHEAFHTEMPGRVDLWPVVPKTEAPEDLPWFDPVDRPEPSHHDLVLSRRIAAEIAALCAGGETIPFRDDAGRVARRELRPGDFLVLVQRRSTIFAELIRACKAERLPIAGADRLRLGGELAVKDIAALLAFLATPEDDLSLAAALRSPLFGWSEDRLYGLAHGRGERFLWEVLRERSEPDTVPVLNDLRAAADFLRPFELIGRILTRHEGRRRLLARLGPEAEDGIDALVAQALAYERSGVPSLTGFLTWMQTDDVEVKRQLDSGGGVVRVMTVHGAKGLEAPVVILPDTRAPAQRDSGATVQMPSGRAVWKWRAEDMPEAMAEAVAARKARLAEERMRLLYVAMTRAESWLIVAGAGDAEKGDRPWHAVVNDALVAAGAVPHRFPTGEGLRLQEGDWAGPPLVAPSPAGTADVSLPAWVQLPAPAPVVAPSPLSPSDLGGAKVLPGDPSATEDADARRRGRLLHRLLETLPPLAAEARTAAALRALATGEDRAEGAEAEALSSEAARLLSDPALDAVFADGAIAEVEVAAALPQLGGRRIVGAIDRLVIAPNRVLIVDFKTNALVPDRPEDTPEGLLRQLAAYAAALAPLYPDRSVEAAILWTATGRLMPIPAPLLAAALARVTFP